MKLKSIITITCAILCFCALPVTAQTNSPATNTSPSLLDVAKTSVATNINQVVIEILSGVKGASGEIYGASKSAIVQSVAFAKEQVPDVVHQFLVWQFWENALWYFVWLIPSFLLWIGSFRIYAYYRKSIKSGENWSDDEICGNGALRWIALILGFIVAMINTCNYGAAMLKIGLAPKVYMLEYVVNLIQNYR
jgi:hypothetical protein